MPPAIGMVLGIPMTFQGNKVGFPKVIFKFHGSSSHSDLLSYMGEHLICTITCSGAKKRRPEV